MNIWQDVDIAVTVPVNLMPLIDDTDFKSREIAIAYNESGMDLVWNFQTTAGVTSQTAIIPTTTGDYDWTHSGNGMYKIEMPASGGASINNDTEGFGWLSGICDGVLAWRGPVMGFRAAALNNSLIDAGEALSTQEAVLTRLASSVYGSGICSSGVTVTNGTILSGDVSSTCTINQTYLKIQETGQFTIDFDFTGLSSTEDKINLIYRYFGAGSTNHKVECLMWNYTLSQWDDMLATDKDYPSTEQDSNVAIDIPGTVSDYFTGTTPNIACKVRVYHSSNYNPDHQFWIDYITLGELEQIYTAPDNAGIAAISDVVGKALLQHTTIATLISQTSFTLSEGSTDDNAYNNALIIIRDKTTIEQKAVGLISDYDGATKEITLSADPAIFTMAENDIVDIMGNTSVAVLANTIISEKVDTLLDINKPQDLTVDVTTRLEYQWLDSDGDAVDISALTFKFKAVKDAGESSPAIPEVTGTISDGPNGRWYFDILPTTVFKGRYEIWAVDGASKITPLTNAGGARIVTHPRL